MAIMLYGIPNCDTVKKARNWLDRHDIAYAFHDFKKSGISRDLIDGWLGSLDWEVLINRKGTTWRGLSDQGKASVIDAKSAAELMLAAPSIVKRPVLAFDDGIHVGFSDELYQRLFNK
jgi:arsenate reductase (glutaredoxin)